VRPETLAAIDERLADAVGRSGGLQAGTRSGPEREAEVLVADVAATRAATDPR
jgi:hypothetical protein